MITNRKIVFVMILLLAGSSTVTWTKIEDEQAQETKKKKKKAEETFWEKVKARCPSSRDVVWFCAGAVYPFLRITHDSTPTLGQYSKMALRRGLWGYGALSGMSGLINFFKSRHWDYPIKTCMKDAKGLLDPVLRKDNGMSLMHLIALTHVACRGLLFPGDSVIPQVVGVILYELSGFDSTDFCSENYNWFLRGSLVGSLLGVGVRYRKDFAGGIRQTPLLIKQLPAFVKTIGSYVPYIAGKKLASSIS